MRVVILTGVPGAGKSTYAVRLASEYEKGRAQILSLDRFRVAIWGSKANYWYRVTPAMKQQLSETYDFALINAMTYEAAECLILDNTHITGTGWGGDTVGSVMKCCRLAGIKPEVVVMRLPLAVALKRNEQRQPDDMVPASLVDKAWDLHESPEAWWRTYDGNVTQAGGASAWENANG